MTKLHKPTASGTSSTTTVSIDRGDGLEAAERDMRLVDAYYHELAVEASEDPRVDTDDERAADADLLATLSRLTSSPQ